MKSVHQQSSIPSQQKGSSGKRTSSDTPEVLSQKLKISLSRFSFSNSPHREAHALKSLSTTLDRCFSLPPEQVSDPAFRKLVGFAALRTGSSYANRKTPPEQAEKILLKGLAAIKDGPGEVPLKIWGLTGLSTLYLKAGKIAEAKEVCCACLPFTDIRWLISGQVYKTLADIYEKIENPALTEKYREAALAFYGSYIGRQVAQNQDPYKFSK